MANLLIGWSDWGDAATVDEVSHETTSFEGTQVQATQPTDYWEAQNAAPYIIFDRGSAQTWNVVAGLFSNMASGDTWRIRTAATKANLTAAPSLDTGSLTFRVAGDDDTWDRHHGLYYVDGGRSDRWMRIDFAVAGGTLELGRIVIGNLFQPTSNDSYGRAFGPSDPSDTQRTDGGALYTDDRTPFLTTNITLGFLSEAEAYGNVFDLLRRRGSRNDVLYIGNPTESTYLMQQIIYGQIARVRPLALPQFGRYEVRLRIEEML